MALEAITLVRNDEGLLPLAPETRGLLVFSPSVMMSYVGKNPPERIPIGVSFGDEVRKLCPSAQVVRVDSIVTDEVARYAQERALKADILLYGCTHAYISEAQSSLIRSLAGLKKPLIVVSLTTPYDLAKFPEVKTYLAAYNATEFSVKAAVQVLFGKAAASGKLPVPIPDLYPIGHGLSLP